MLELTRDTREKLKRYMINADPFLWGILESKNKKTRILELKARGYLESYSASYNPNYSKINMDLLVEIGIEGIFDRIVIPKVHSLFAKDVMDFFRCWEQGQAPTIKYLREQGLYRKRVFTTREYFEGSHTEEPPAGYKDPPFVFVQINTQQNFVERWTVFGGLWFEEIEPLLD